MLRVNRVLTLQRFGCSSLSHSSISASSSLSVQLISVRALSTTPPTGGAKKENTPVKQGFGMSLRDSFRRVEQQRTEAAAKQVAAASGNTPMTAKDVHTDLLRSVTAKVLNKHSSDAILEVEGEAANALTEGDLRFKQQQQKLQIKREKLDQMYGPRGKEGQSQGQTQGQQGNKQVNGSANKAKPQGQQQQPQQQSDSQQQPGNKKQNPSNQQSQSQNQQQGKDQTQQGQQNNNNTHARNGNNSQQSQGGTLNQNNNSKQQSQGQNQFTQPQGQGQGQKQPQHNNNNNGQKQQQHHQGANNQKQQQGQGQSQNNNQKPQHNHNNNNNNGNKDNGGNNNKPQHHNNNNNNGGQRPHHNNNNQSQRQSQGQSQSQGHQHRQQSQHVQRQGQRHHNNNNNQGHRSTPHSHNNTQRGSAASAVQVPVVPEAVSASSAGGSAGQALDIKQLVEQYRQKIETRKTPFYPSIPSVPRGMGQSPKTRETRERDREEREREAKGPTTVVKEVVIPSAGLTLRELASRLSMKISVLTCKLEEMGELSVSEGERERESDAKGKRARERERERNGGGTDGEGERDIGERLIDADVAELVVLELGLSPKRLSPQGRKHSSFAFADLSPSQKEANRTEGEEPTNAAPVMLIKRAPTVCVLGHVDHGKTTLLDALRGVSKDKDKRVAGREAGGITQRLSAFTVEVEREGETKGEREKVVFLDTPGHAAFSAMRGQGAMATDIAVLVVALDDGVQPQTIEALKTARERQCSIIVALTKADKFPVENGERSKARSRVLAQLAQLDLLTEDYGGDAQVAEVSGRTGEGVRELVESILVQAEVMDLKANARGQAEAVVLDAQLERGRGIVADVLVKWGCLSVGDAVVVGSSFGRVKSMFDDAGKVVRESLPSQPVRLLGLRSIPSTGSELLSLESESEARRIAERRARLAELKQAREQAALLGSSSTANSPTSGTVVGEDGTPVVSQVKPVLGVLLKADSLGSIEALKTIVSDIASLSAEEVTVKVLGASVGDVTLSDVERVSAVSGDTAVVLGFNIGIADNNTKMTAKQMDVSITRDEVIYRLEEDLVRRIEELMPKQRLVSKEGSAKVLKVFKIKRAQVSVVAGLSVQSGSLRNGSIEGDNTGFYFYRVIRNGEVVLDESKGEVDLKRFKDSVKEVESGNECGLSLDGFHDFQEGDEIECYRVELQAKTLASNGYVPSKVAPTNSANAFAEQAALATGKKTKK